MFCFHVVVSGFGMMGDCLICIKCGKEKYPEAFGWYIKELPKTEENMQKARLAREMKKRKEELWKKEMNSMKKSKKE